MDATLNAGRPGEHVCTSDRGLQYGDGLFETVSGVAGQPRWLALHLERLQRGCERLQLPFRDFQALRGEIAALAAGAQRCLVKVIVTRGRAERRGYAPSGGERPTRIVSRHPWPQAAPRAWSGFRLGISGVRLGINPLLAGLKHLNRLEQVLAQRALEQARLDEVLMLSSSELVIGGSMSNVFFADAAGLITPALGDCGIAGVMRGLVLEAAAKLGIPVQVRGVHREELGDMREAFVTNVRWGVQSVDLMLDRALESRTQALALQRLIDAPHD